MMSEGSGNKRCYVDNAMNRNLGRVGMPLRSMPVSSRGNSTYSSGASYFGSSLSDGGRTYVDNYLNRGLGRVGMPRGSMPVSSRGSSTSSSGASYFGSSLSDGGRTYVDNYMNRGLGRVEMPFESIVVSNRGHSPSHYDYSDICLPLSDSKRAEVEDYMNRVELSRIGIPLRYSNTIPASEAIAILENTWQQMFNSSRDESEPTLKSCRKLPAPSKTDNEYNQGLEGVNSSAACSMTESSRERSTSPSSVYSRESSSTGTKHDVGGLTNKSFEQVDLPYGANIKDENVYEEKPRYRNSVHYCKGKSPPSSVSSRKSSASAPNDTFGSNNSSSRKKYVDNALNRNHGRVDMPYGSKSVSKSESTSSSSSKTYWDNEYKRGLERMGVEHGSIGVSKDSRNGSLSGTKHYVDGSANRSLGRVGLPDGACGEVRVYKDNPFNQKLGRVGLPHRAAGQPRSKSPELKFYADKPENRRLGRPKGSFSGSKRTDCDNNLNRQLGRVGKELGTEPMTCIKETERPHKGYIRYRENPDEDIDYQNLPALPKKVEEDAIRVEIEHDSLVVSNDSGIVSSKGITQCEDNSKSKSSSKTYVDNKYNRQLGRVGLEHGSMVVSKDSELVGSKETKQNIVKPKSRSSSSTKMYLGNKDNRRLEKVGLEHGSKDSETASSKGIKQCEDNSKSKSSSKTYVDNKYNRQLGRVGLEHGSMVVSKDSGLVSSKETKQNIDKPKSRSSSSTKIYLGNKDNRRLEKVGLEHGSKDSGTASPKGIKHYVDNSKNRSLGRVGLPYGADSEQVRVYKDNLLNRKLGRVGLPIGAKVQSKSGSLELKFYADNPENRRFGRVGFPMGSRPKSSFPRPKRTYCDNYLNRQLGRVGMELGTAPVTSHKKIEWFQKAYQRLKENPEEDIDFDSFPVLSSEEREDAIEQIVHAINRKQLEREWQEKADQVPKTSDYLLHYTGPVIEYSEIKLGQIIGSGGFGIVYYGTYKDSVVAVKKLNEKQVNGNRIKEFVDEVNILCKLDNQFIVKFIGACIKPPNLCIVMEYMQISLHEALHVRCTDMNDFTDDDRQKIIIQTLSGLEYLHDKNVAHCDIKPGNILIDHDGGKFTVAKLSDFGLSKMKNETKSSVSSDSGLYCNLGTPIYSSPERLRREYLNLKQMKMSDMYSYGLVVFEILCEIRPFRNLSFTQLQNQVGLNNIYPKFPYNIHPNVHLEKMLLGCWDRKPENRPTATEFLKLMKRISYVYETLD